MLFVSLILEVIVSNSRYATLLYDLDVMILTLNPAEYFVKNYQVCFVKDTHRFEGVWVSRRDGPYHPAVNLWKIGMLVFFITTGLYKIPIKLFIIQRKLLFIAQN